MYCGIWEEYTETITSNDTLKFETVSLWIELIALGSHNMYL